MTDQSGLSRRFPGRDPKVGLNHLAYDAGTLATSIGPGAEQTGETSPSGVARLYFRDSTRTPSGRASPFGVTCR